MSPEAERFTEAHAWYVGLLLHDNFRDTPLRVILGNRVIIITSPDTLTEDEARRLTGFLRTAGFHAYLTEAADQRIVVTRQHGDGMR